MSFPTVGDALHYHRLRQDGNTLKTDLHRLTTELSTGRHEDIGRARGGDFSMLSDIGRRLELTGTFSETIAQAALDANMRQNALAKVEGEVSGFGAAILGFSFGGSLSDLMLTIGNSADRLSEAVNALNTRAAGRSLFSGDAPDRPALISGEAMLDELRPLVAGAADVTDMMTIVDDWFMASGGGYETAAWQGGTGAAPPVILGEGVQQSTGISGLDPAIRKTLSGLALAALAAEGAGPSTEADQRALSNGAAARMQDGETAIITLRSDLGNSQARIEAARVELEATRATLQLEEARLTEIDPYQTATDLEAVQARLESLYILTARISRLTLSEYLR